MLSPRVLDLVERCRRAQQAAVAYAPLIEELRRAEAGQEGDVELFPDDAFKGKMLQFAVEEVGTAGRRRGGAERAYPAFLVRASRAQGRSPLAPRP